MTTKIASALVTIGIILSAATLGAPAASADPVAPASTPAVGSVAICFTVPLGFFSFSICI
ncbi:hypothetical protein [Nocardia sp. NPDC050710]|uniref:hypothetical protein n=1 Tax=Nocardia sp. NPDC050710 TaxID=3157220 RepID=UPI003409CBE6